MYDNQDVYARVTNKIIADLEKGELTWRQPWKAGHAAGPITKPLRYNGEPYRGINVLMLWAWSLEKGFVAPIWMTFKQSAALGAHVRKGEHGSLVVFASRMKKTDQGDNGEEVEREIPFLKGYTVFNVEQIEGLPAQYYERVEPVHPSPLERVEAAERFFANTGADIRHGGTRAFYWEGGNFVQMPELQTFRDAESYYAIAAHEVTHWTRHPMRLERDFGCKRRGDKGYAMEELVAEIGAAFLCADLGLTLEPREDHAAYIASWLRALKDDKKMIFVAASHAQRATDFLHGLQPKPEPGPEPPGQVSERDPARGLPENALR
jgi:antirestriction protein ArdC